MRDEALDCFEGFFEGESDAGGLVEIRLGRCGQRMVAPPVSVARTVIWAVPFWLAA